VTTRRGDTVYVHVLDWPDTVLSIPSFGARILNARMLASGQTVEVTQTDAGITLTLPPATDADIDRVVVLETGRR
jgi:alpha-L-fucosidase